MVKDFFKGFLYTLGKILAFIFIMLVIGTLLTRINTDDIKVERLPFKQLLMNLFFVNGHALTAKFYNANQLCATCTTATNNCYYSGSGTCANIGKVSIISDDLSLVSGNKYRLATTIYLGFNTNSCPSTLPFRGDYYIGNKAGSSWNSASTVTYNHIENFTSSNCRYTWGFIQEVNNTVNSTGLTFDFYFSTPQSINYLKVTQFDLTNLSAGTDAAINNQTNNIINNNNQNTQQIINNNNQNTQQIINSQNETTGAINDLNDTLNDTSSPDTNDFLEDSKNKIMSDTPITDLLRMPYNLYNNFMYGLDSGCSSYNFGSLYGHTLSLPCINLQEFIGSNLWRIIDILFSGFMILNIGELIIHDFSSLTTLEDLFDETYTPKHVYHPKHGKE